jgi:glycosyltransferase involved in cell wall biosynthesis
MLTVIFITASDGSEGRNYEHIMRMHFLSRETHLTMLTQKNSDFTRYLTPKTKVVTAPHAGKRWLLFFGLYWISRHRGELHNSIIITEPSTLGIIGFVAKVLAGSKWVVDVWDIPIRNTRRNIWARMRLFVTRFVMRMLYKRADLFIVGIRPDMEFRYYRIPDRKVLAWQTTIWIPESNPAVPQQTNGANRPFKILCMKSEHDPACGLDVLADAFSVITQDIPAAQLWIVGSIRSDAKAHIENLQRYPNVIICGLLEHSKLMELIREADICVLPWHNVVDLDQLYPTKVMEYMSEGKVVVAARLAGIAEMIKDGYNGILFSPGDAKALAEKVIALYKDSELRKSIANNAREYNERFDTRAKHRKIVEALDGLFTTQGVE